MDEEFKLEIAGTCTQLQATWTPKKVSNRHLCYMEVCNLHRVVSISFIVYAVEKFAQLFASENGYRLNVRRAPGGWGWWFSFQPCLLSLFVHFSTISLGYDFRLFYGDLTFKYWTILWRRAPATLNWIGTGEKAMVLNITKWVLGLCVWLPFQTTKIEETLDCCSHGDESYGVLLDCSIGVGFRFPVQLFADSSHLDHRSFIFPGLDSFGWNCVGWLVVVIN